MLTRDGRTWTARAYWTDGGGVRRSRQKGGFRTKAEAARWEQETKAAGERASPSAGFERPTVGDLADAYNDRLRARGASPSTVSAMDMARRHYGPILEAVRASDLTPLAVQECVDAMGRRADGTDYRAASVRQWYRALRAVLNYGVAMGAMPCTPCVGIRLPAQQEHEATIYTGAQVAKLLAAMRGESDPLYWPISLCARNALRRGEAIGARWCDLDLEAGTLHVRASLTTAGTSTFLKRVKTKASDAVVALPADFAQDLRDLRRRRREAGTLRVGDPSVQGVVPKASLDPAEFVCLTGDGRIWAPNTVGRYLARFQDDHGLPVSTVHDLRHTYGTLLAEAGTDLTTISKAMRHSGVGITADLYISPTSAIVRRATDIMDGLIGMRPGDGTGE